MERSACHVCCGNGFNDFAALDHRRIVRCRDCGYVFAHLFDEDTLFRAYAEDYYASAEDPRIGRKIQNGAPVWAGVCRTLERRIPRPKRLLDIGAGTGGFLMEFHRRHPQVELFAIESASAARAHLISKLPQIRFPADDAMKLHDISEFFDLVVLLQTLEHVYAPDRLCRAIYNRLNAGGAAFITVPNLHSFRVLLKKTRDGLNLSNRTHLQFFSKGSLERLLKNAGFRNVRRIIDFGGGQVSGALQLLQWGLRAGGISNELRYIAVK